MIPEAGAAAYAAFATRLLSPITRHAIEVLLIEADRLAPSALVYERKRATVRSIVNSDVQALDVPAVRACTQAPVHDAGGAFEAMALSLRVVGNFSSLCVHDPSDPIFKYSC